MDWNVGNKLVWRSNSEISETKYLPALQFHTLTGWMVSWIPPALSRSLIEDVLPKLKLIIAFHYSKLCLQSWKLHSFGRRRRSPVLGARPIAKYVRIRMYEEEEFPLSSDNKPRNRETPPNLKRLRPIHQHLELVFVAVLMHWCNVIIIPPNPLITRRCQLAKKTRFFVLRPEKHSLQISTIEIPWQTPRQRKRGRQRLSK